MNSQQIPRVQIVVLHWKNYSHTCTALASLAQLSYPNYGVLVVDNFSADGSIERLQDAFPAHAFLMNESNLGFSRGCNRGIRAALDDRECAYVLLVNNDATITPDGLGYAVGFAESNPKCGALSGKILTSRSTNKLWYAGGRISRLRGQAIVRGFGDYDQGQFDSCCEVGFVTGALMLIKREVLETVGLLPEEYFFGAEEWDFSLALKRAGYKLFYFPQFVGYHAADGSHWNYDPKFVYNSYRNKLIFQEKYLPRLVFPLWKKVFSIYGSYLARTARQRLIGEGKFKVNQPVKLNDLDFALTRAIKDHGTNRLSEGVLNMFEKELHARRSSTQPTASSSIAGGTSRP
jgi:GT2 family glycosyltransferase